MKKIIFFCFLCILICLNNPTFAANKKINRQPAKETLPITIVPNFETKKTEIIDILNLNKKQQDKANKIYEKAKNEIIGINRELKIKYEAKKDLKLSKEDTRIQLEKHIKLNNEIDSLYQKRDKLHNSSLKKFEKILNKKQAKIWNDIKIKGARLFPDIDTLN